MQREQALGAKGKEQLTTSATRIIALLASGSHADENGEEREDGETHGDRWLD